jgi:outer membrane protein TolC
MKHNILFIFLLFGAISINAQEILTLEQAVEKTLNSNLNIKVFRNNIAVAENNSNMGNAGMLPNVTLNGATNYSSNNTKLEFAGNIAPVEQNGAQSTSNNLSVNLNYTLFDGLAMFYNYDILKASKSQTEIQTRLNIENTLLQVIAGYYEMARLQNQMKIGKEALAISKERYRRAKTYNEFGGSSKIEFLSAEVDLNTDSSAFLNAELAWVNSRRNLNFLMGVENDLMYKVEEDVTLNKDLAIENLFDKAKQNNAGVMNAEYNILISEKQLKTTKSTLLPTIAANASYGYSGSNNEVGIVLSNQNTGFNAGLSLTYPLFRGGVQSTQRQNAQIQLENATLQKELAEKQLVRDLNNAFSTYQNAIRVVELNEKNLVTAKLNFNRTKELYDLGKVTNTQFREAQLNFARTKSTLVNSSFQVKLAEADLIRISGSLLE